MNEVSREKIPVVARCRPSTSPERRCAEEGGSHRFDCGRSERMRVISMLPCSIEVSIACTRSTGETTDAHRRAPEVMPSETRVIYFLFVYSKLELDSLSESQKSSLKTVANALRDAWPSS